MNMKTKEELINKLIEANNYKRYLEIGTQFGTSVNKINCEVKHTVDPVKSFQGNLKADQYYQMTSDDFFSQLGFDFVYDIIFIDGLHHADQVLTDICNAGARLSSDGVIICHDLMPTEEIIQKVPRENNIWTGDCWKVWHLLIKGNYDITLKFNDFDWGVGEIRFGRNGLDEILVDFTDNLDRLEHITYENDFNEYRDAVRLRK